MKRFFLILLLLSLLLQTGCAVAQAAEADRPAPMEAPDAGEGARLIFAEDAFDQGRGAPGAVCYDRLEVRLTQLDPEELKNLFFSRAGDPITSEANDPPHIDWSGYSAHGSDGAFLHARGGVESGMVYYHVPWEEKTSLLVRDEPADIGMVFEINNLDRLPREGDLPFAAAREAEDAVRALLDRLGCRHLGAAEVYPISHETYAKLDAATRRYDMDSTDSRTVLPPQEWTEADDCYYLAFRGGYDSLPFCREGFARPGTWACAYYGARGIEFLEVVSPLEVTGTGTEIPMPAEKEARARIAQKFEEDLRERGHDVVVHEVSLEYVLTSRAAETLVPVWRVILEEVDAITGIDARDGRTGLVRSEWDCYFFDALTGEEYVGN